MPNSYLLHHDSQGSSELGNSQLTPFILPHFPSSEVSCPSCTLTTPAPRVAHSLLPSVTYTEAPCISNTISRSTRETEPRLSTSTPRAYLSLLNKVILGENPILHGCCWPILKEPEPPLQ